jgi:ketosteroid isomerase-like protein
MMAREVGAFLQSYARAFSDFDVDAICRSWAYPAYFVARGRRAALDAEAFRANTQALCTFYRARGMTEATKELLEITCISPGTALVRTADVLRGGDGGTIAAWEHVYLLSHTADGLKLVAAMPDGELAAWQARGTPLGDW